MRALHVLGANRSMMDGPYARIVIRGMPQASQGCACASCLRMCVCDSGRGTQRVCSVCVCVMRDRLWTRSKRVDN